MKIKNKFLLVIFEISQIEKKIKWKVNVYTNNLDFWAERKRGERTLLGHRTGKRVDWTKKSEEDINWGQMWSQIQIFCFPQQLTRSILILFHLFCFIFHVISPDKNQTKPQYPLLLLVDSKSPQYLPNLFIFTLMIYILSISESIFLQYISF